MDRQAEPWPLLRQLQGELLAELGKLVLTPLGGQDQDDYVERHQRDRASQP